MTLKLTGDALTLENISGDAASTEQLSGPSTNSVLSAVAGEAPSTTVTATVGAATQSMVAGDLISSITNYATLINVNNYTPVADTAQFFINGAPAVGTDVVAASDVVTFVASSAGFTDYSVTIEASVDAAAVTATDITLSASDIDENSVIGSIIGTLGSDASPAATFSVIGDPDGKFSISGTNLELAAAIDWETATTHSLTIRADNTAVGGSTFDKAFTITVNNIADAPVTATVAPAAEGLISGARLDSIANYATLIDVNNYTPPAATAGFFINGVLETDGSTLFVASDQVELRVTEANSLDFIFEIDDIVTGDTTAPVINAFSIGVPTGTDYPITLDITEIDSLPVTAYIGAYLTSGTALTDPEVISGTGVGFGQFSTSVDVVDQPVDLGALLGGAYTVKVVVVDGAGNESSDTDTFTVVQDGINITVPSSSIPSDLTDFPLKVDLEDIPASMWTDVNTGGGNLRAYEADGVTEIPMDLVWADNTLQQGTAFVKKTLSSSADTSIVIKATAIGNAKHPVTDPNGRDAVWSDYEAVIMGPEPTVDRTGAHTPVANAAFPSGSDIVFELEQSSVMEMQESHQGLAFHNDFWYVIDTDAIYKYDLKWNLVTSVTGVSAATGITGANHLSDGMVHNGELVIPVGEYPRTAGYIEHFGRFDLNTLAFIGNVDASAQSRLIASCAVNPADGNIYTVDFDDGSSLQYYDPTTFAYLGSLVLSSSIPFPQAIAFLNGKIYINSDDVTNKTVEVELDGTVNATSYYDAYPQTGNWEGLTVRDGSLYMLHDTEATSSVWRIGEYRANDAIHFEDGNNQILVSGLGMSQVHTSSVFAELAGNFGANAQVSGLNNTTRSNRTSTALRATSTPDSWDYWDSNNSWATPAPARAEHVGDGYQFAVAYNGSTERKGFLNGQAYGVQAGITATPTTDTSLMWELGSRGATPIDLLAGNIRFATLRYEYMSNDWISVEYENLHGDLYTVS